MLRAPRYEALVAEGANLHEYRELERRDEGDAIYRRLLGRPELPAALAMLVARIAPGAGPPSYVEEQWRSKSRMEVRWRMQPSVLPDRSRIEGTLRVEPLDAERCRRVLDGVVEVDLSASDGSSRRPSRRRWSMPMPTRRSRCARCE